MRLMLKYREVAGLGDAAQELVSFSRRTRAFDQLLHDPARAGVVLVSLDEPVVLAESLRLDAALRATNVAVLGVIVNRVGGPDEGVAPTLEWPSPVIVAPESERPPTGLQAISDWCCRWRARDLAHGSE
jgi:anion-transporting  ArsA/GET3 family ATPase